MIRLGIAMFVSMISLHAQFTAAADKPSLAGSQKAMKSISWILGTWKMSMGGSESFEYWKQSTPDSFIGGGFSLNGKDTTFSEKLALAATDSGLFYIADVAHNAAPTYFKMTSQDSMVTVFENPEHDFPTRVVYRRVASDSLHARIEGMRKGKPAGIDFVFQRVK
jgi:hypothetical protein